MALPAVKIAQVGEIPLGRGDAAKLYFSGAGERAERLGRRLGSKLFVENCDNPCHFIRSTMSLPFS